MSTRPHSTAAPPAPAPAPAPPTDAAPSAVDPIGPNAELLRRTLALIERLSDRQYVHVEERLSSASIGAHVRHVLDHYRQFLAGLPLGEIDYDARARDTEVERSVEAASAEARRLIAELSALQTGAGTAASGRAGPDWAARPLRVRQQGDEVPGRFDGCESHALRELLFLASHAVHHQALIAVLARAQGLAVPERFGLAPSTATWQASQAGHAAETGQASGGSRACAR
ncbi:MAG TPA: DinB family protein [Planctomycetota bacterium]|nr:DinB family protein [Planctomycetota bacterium]